MTLVIAASRGDYTGFARGLAAELGERVEVVSERARLTPEALDELAPRFVFFPHWSFIIPRSIHEHHECVIFHMTDLPFGRGGSPLQNLIVRGVHETRLSALRCVAELDAGPVYLKEPLSLEGAAEEIYLRAGELVKSMIGRLAREEIEPQPQVGEPVTFRRRTPEESDVAGAESLPEVFDLIRMLDATGYPHAFLETESLRYEFTRAWRGKDEVVADVRITRRPDSAGGRSPS